MGKKYWGVSASRGNDREFSELCFEYGIFCLGGETQKETAKKVKTGDVLILKKSCGEGGRGYSFYIVAIGIVQSTFELDERFNDVDGWELNCVADVEWYRVPGHYAGMKKLERKLLGLKRGTIDKINSQEPKKFADEILRSDPDKIPKEKDKNNITIETIKDTELENFFSQQNSNRDDIERQLEGINNLRKSAASYDYDSLIKATEEEVRAFLILPLLYTIGWTPELLRLEAHAELGGRMDVSLYGTPHNFQINAKPLVVIEVKRADHGLEAASAQAKKYGCQIYLVTNGLAYRLYYGSSPMPVAYMNIKKMEKHYRFNENVDGTLGIFGALSPKKMTRG